MMEALLLKILEGQEKTDKKLDVIEGSINHIQDEIVVIKGDIKGLQGDIKGLQGDIKGLQADIKGLQADMQVVKSDIVDLKETVHRIEMNQEETIVSMLRHIKKKVDKSNNLSFKKRVN